MSVEVGLLTVPQMTVRGNGLLGRQGKGMALGVREGVAMELVMEPQVCQTF